MITLSSCETELELTSPSELTAAGFWDTENGAIAAHTGLYTNLRSTNATFWMLGEIRSDIWGGQTFESPANISLIESNITATTAPFGGWAGIYTRIHRLNDFIANIQSIEFTTASDKSHYLGQAHGLRALYYYTLLKTWGDVPITTLPLTSVNPSELNKARSPQSEVMVLIKSDIEDSLDAFGSDNSFWKGSKVYWSKAATLALKGDVYIWSGNLLGGGASDFNIAKTALSNVAAAGVSLEDNYDGLWGASNENNNEFIFAIQYKQDEASNFYNSFTGRGTEINPQFDAKGNSMANFAIAGSNRYGQTEKTINMLGDADDSRGDATFIRLYVDDNGGAGYPIYDNTKYFGSVFNKYLGRLDGSDRIFESDTPLYRYADVVLMLAEVKNLLNEDPSGEINQIRARAYGTNYTIAIHGYTNGSQADNTNAILNERYKEFIGEGKRWWDLRRAGNSYVLNNISFLSAGDEYKFLLPITIDMIGRNSLLEQTTGYTN